jgi:CHASE1-domain containing sensor protein
VRLDAVEVKGGDHLDFVVDMRAEYSFDSFTWVPKVRFTDAAAASARAEWSARDDFSGPQPKVEPLTPWQQYAQALLLANEFMFVD